MTKRWRRAAPEDSTEGNAKRPDDDDLPVVNTFVHFREQLSPVKARPASR